MNSDVEKVWAMIELDCLLNILPARIPTKEQMNRVEELKRIVYGNDFA